MKPYVQRREGQAAKRANHAAAQVAAQVAAQAAAQISAGQGRIQGPTLAAAGQNVVQQPAQAPPVAQQGHQVPPAANAQPQTQAAQQEQTDGENEEMADNMSETDDLILDMEGPIALNDNSDLDGVRYAHLHFSHMNYPSLIRLDPGWEYGGIDLGSNHSGVARLYLRRDKNRNLIDRIVVKDVFMDHRSWTSAFKWHGTPDTGVPIEIHIMQTIKDRPGSKFCVRICGEPKVNRKELRYRICK